MKPQPPPDSDTRTQLALSELQQLIRQRWPRVSFEITHGDDPKGVYLDTIVDVDDPDEVMDLVVDRLLSLQVDEGLSVHVVPLRGLSRAIQPMPTRGSHG